MVFIAIDFFSEHVFSSRCEGFRMFTVASTIAIMGYPRR
jgi:hypothetical protein